MQSKNIFKIILVKLVLVGILSCGKDVRKIEKIDYTTEYKFNSEIENKVALDTTPWKYQYSASDYAAKGDYKNALRHWDLGFRRNPITFSQKEVDSINNKYRIESAADYILEESKSNQIIIINEAHHNSFHRMFSKSLLQRLYDNGYRNLGLEALGNGERFDSLLLKRKYPVLDTGYYIKDPQFGDLIRTALEIGYNVFPYEQTKNVNRKLREIEQAKNIQKVIETKPGEKFIIHCGFDHVLEGKHSSWEKAMAERLKEYTGIDPFTINQVVYSEKSKPELNHPFLKSLDIQEPSILIDEKNKPFSYKRGEAWADIAVFHPNTQYVNKRPNWLFENENKNVEIILNDIDITFPVMILAYKEGEDVNQAIPFDITEISNKSENGYLGLKQGKYKIIVTDGKGSYKFNKKVN
ncbi:hypothetical protein GTQ40_01135 [Flavobacteriaceae bacterium R38]|nr:hypothetical protein [Flavobacteriaceae bacterium R38]